jgi:hypothetical protein
MGSHPHFLVELCLLSAHKCGSWSIENHPIQYKLCSIQIHHDVSRFLQVLLVIFQGSVMVYFHNCSITGRPERGYHGASLIKQDTTLHVLIIFTF